MPRFIAEQLDDGTWQVRDSTDPQAIVDFRGSNAEKRALDYARQQESARVV